MRRLPLPLIIAIATSCFFSMFTAFANGNPSSVESPFFMKPSPRPGNLIIGSNRSLSAIGSPPPFSPIRTLKVCPSGCDYKIPSEAIASAEDFNLIEVQAGIYADCAVVPSRLAHLWLRSVGGMAHMMGIVCEEKGAFVVNGAQTIFENFEFSGLHIACESGQNAVGIRLQAGDLFVINSYFHDSQGGLLTGSGSTSNITIVNSRFSRLGKNITHCASNPFTWFHNIYVGVEASFALKNSIVEDNFTGNLVKSRAYKTVLECNQMMNGYDAKYIKNGYLVDLPQGGDERLNNNIIAQGPQNGGQQIMIAYGAEIQPGSSTKPNPLQSLELSKNVLINDLGKGTSVQMFSATSVPAEMSNNVFIGAGTGIGGIVSSVTESDDRRYANRSVAGESLVGVPHMPSACSTPIGTVSVH